MRPVPRVFRFKPVRAILRYRGWNLVAAVPRDKVVVATPAAFDKVPAFLAIASTDRDLHPWLVVWRIFGFPHLLCLSQFITDSTRTNVLIVKPNLLPLMKYL